jgi:hypothetical protein
MFGFLFLAFVGLLAFLLIRAGAKPGTVVFILVGIFVPLSIALAAWFHGLSANLDAVCAAMPRPWCRSPILSSHATVHPAVGVALTSW